MEYIRFGSFFIILFCIQTIMEGLGTFIHLTLSHNLTVMENQMHESSFLFNTIVLISSFFIYIKLFFQKIENYSDVVHRKLLFLLVGNTLAWTLFVRPQWNDARWQLLSLHDIIPAVLFSVSIIYIPLQLLNQLKTFYSRLLLMPIVLFLFKFLLIGALQLDIIWGVFHLINLMVVFKKEFQNVYFQLLYFIFAMLLPNVLFGIGPIFHPQIGIFSISGQSHWLALFIFLTFFNWVGNKLSQLNYFTVTE